MKKVISLVTGVSMLLSSFILPVSAETEPSTEPEKIYDTALSSDTNKITDLEQIAGLLKNYIDENHPGDATVAINDKDSSLDVIFRKTAIGEEEFDGEIIYWNMAEYLEENNVDSSFISNKFTVSFLAAATAATSSVTTGDINFNGSIDVTDLTELSLVLIGDKELSANQQKAADVDGDGAVTLADLARLQQYLSKKIDKL
ncbi:dockerin type I repeat-containing protein [Ruminococcus sp. HUN007]|uniref:dockerin type I repeat-containing protein n=1 Tax=Ruminococcus sp. HUN007 TaxID=1514668 RepID=UPI0005D1C9D6|nr:dockerin type I repeat-containing protein [Ruminococcus sp. HUN007]